MLVIQMTNSQPQIKSNQEYSIRYNNQLINQFIGEDIFKEWCKLFGVVPTKVSEHSEPTLHIATWESNHVIFERGYTNESEIPTGAIKCHGVMGTLVTECYVLNKDLITYVYRPLPSLAMYRQVPNVLANYFKSYNGYIAKA
ncbi:hypothetical protein ACQUY5_16775 [Bacillus cereus]|uniref:hypothetical protein n=1 Tax=Bacillus cereus TaxID=1396 RepID=UPI003D183D70